MKGMKGRILKKLKSIPHVGYLKEGRVLHMNASDGLLEDSPPHNPGRFLCDLPVTREENPDSKVSNPTTPSQPEIINVDDLMRDLEDEEPDLSSGNKENIRPVSPPKHPASWKKKSENSLQSETEDHNSEVDMPAFRRPDLNSDTLFDPDLLAAFEQAVMDHMRSYEEARSTARAPKEEEEEEESLIDEEPPSKVPRKSEDYVDPLMEFEERCPPGAMGAIVLYTTTLRGVRKTFEDCNSVRFLLGSLKLVFLERDVSMHMVFREELWRVLGGRTIPPRLFINGRYIGGADEVLGLHEQGKLLPLVQGLQLERSGGAACKGCGGVRFMLCCECNGSRKLYHDENGMHIQCNHCNENGLIPCPICC
ncbi:uncharacterized protein At5g39865-like [Phoenix dactylifera]|uniref:Uncharacterized protein At5g39865-like n=1 Tax=Phoenix dactylifera TaxID=42345 RepID=A0A8B7CLK1_PHODC|nr:uncharacterized protein At5g39865-like [Phoenix dactylifera]